jgi:hypothetical protein
VGTIVGFLVDQRRQTALGAARKQSKLHKLCDLHILPPPRDVNVGYIRAHKIAIHRGI